MARVVITSPRLTPTAQHRQRKGKSRLKAIRKNVTTTKATHTVNAEMDFVILKNDGVNDIKVNFKSDNMANNYWTLKPDESLPTAVGISKNDDIHYESVGGPSKLEIILWA